MAYTVYGFTGSTYTRTVRMILAEKGVPYDLVSVNILAGEGRSPEHLQRHPFGKVPAFQDGDLMLYETTAIADYLEGKHPQPALVPADVTARARMRQWQSVVERSEYLAGSELSLADLYLAPVTAYLAMTEEGRALLAEQSCYNRWWETMQARRSFRETPFQ